MSGGGQAPVTQQTTQTKDPWSVAQPYLAGAMNSASALYNSNSGYTPYTGPTQAPLHPYVDTATQDMANFMVPDAAQGGTAGNTAARGLAVDQLKNAGLTPELRTLFEQAQGDHNPYLEGAIREGVNKANAGASAMGRYGSGSHDAAITQAMSPIMAQDYARRQQQQQDILTGGLQRAGQWAQVMPALDEARYDPARGLLNIGQYYTDRSQAQLKDQIAQYNAQQAYPWESLARYQAIIGGAGGLGGTSVTSSPISQPSTLQKLLGGATAGAGLGATFGGLPGAGIGAVGGSLLSLL